MNTCACTQWSQVQDQIYVTCFSAGTEDILSTCGQNRENRNKSIVRLAQLQDGPSDVQTCMPRFAD